MFTSFGKSRENPIDLTDESEAPQPVPFFEHCGRCYESGAKTFYMLCTICNGWFCKECLLIDTASTTHCKVCNGWFCKDCSGNGPRLTYMCPQCVETIDPSFGVATEHRKDIWVQASCNNTNHETVQFGLPLREIEIHFPDQFLNHLNQITSLQKENEELKNKFQEHKSNK